MKQTIILAVAGALALGGLGGYLIAQKKIYDPRFDLNLPENADVAPSSQPNALGGMHMMPDGTMMGGDSMIGMHMIVSSEREFLTEMIPHHQEAVDTAKQVLARGATTPEIKKLVDGIITAQEKEIADMKTWYQTWYGVPYQDQGTYKPMMRNLSALSGAALDRTFLEDMIMHHMGAIMMAQSVQSHIEHTEIQTLASAIVSSQSAEITQMRSLLATLR